VWLLTAVNCRRIVGAGRVQLATTTLKILPLLLIGIAGTLAFDPSHFSFSAVTGSVGTSVMATVTLTLWAFVGLESATVPAGSTSDARRTIPRATIIGTLIAAAIYLLGTIGVMSLSIRQPWRSRRRHLPTRRGCSLVTARRRSSRSARRFRLPSSQ
jgi:APA family basic amino acid/polyamine antiporter